MTIQALIGKVVGTLLAPLIPILIGLAVIAFFWGLVKYIYGGAKEIGEARQLILWGIISIFAMVSIWGLVSIVQGTFFGGAPLTSPPSVPKF